MPRQVDLSSQAPALTHDPTQQLTPDVGLGGQADMLGDLLRKIPEMLRDEIQRVIETLLDIAVNPIPALQDWAQGLLTPNSSVITQLLGGFQGIDLTSPGGILSAISSGGGILDPSTGLIPEWLLPPTSIGRLTGGRADLVPDGLFSLPPPGGGDSNWFQLPTGGLGGSGAAAITGTGLADELIGKPFGVSEGQTLRPGAQVSWEGGSGSAGSVLLKLFEFSGQSQVGSVTIGSVTPSGTSSWVELADDYTVPAGVDMISLVPAVTEGFTGGTAYFSKVTGPSTIPEGGIFEQSWTKGLPESLTSLLANLTAMVEAGLGGLGIPILGDLTDKIGEFGGGLGGLTSGVGGLAGLFNLGSSDLSGPLDFDDTWNSLWGDKLKSLNWIPNSSQATIDGIWNGWANLGADSDSGLGSGVVPGAISGLLGMNLNNSSAIASAEAAIRALQSAGNTLSDDFVGASASTLGANYNTLTSAGGGAGSVGLDGSGSAVWKPSGSGNRTMIYRYTPAQITTDSGILRAVLSSTPPVTTPDDAYTYVCGWVHSSAQTYLRLQIGASTVVLQAVVAGTVYNLKSWGWSLKSGDTVEVQRGQPGNTSLHRYIMRVNNNQLDDFTDATLRAVSGSGVRGMGVGMETSLRLTIFGPTQWQPAGLAIVTLSEVL